MTRLPPKSPPIWWPSILPVVFWLEKYRYSRPIASLTKILTAYEALNQNFSFTKATVYSKDKFASYDNPLKLVNGEKINNKDLLNVMLVGSVNNVARMVAQNTGLTEETFVKDVNRRLEDWGADYTDITDVTGLDAGNKSTPRDLLKIFTKVLSDEQILKALSQTSYYFKEMVDKNGQRSHTVKNTNQLFPWPDAVIKFWPAKPATPMKPAP